MSATHDYHTSVTEGETLSVDVAQASTNLLALTLYADLFGDLGNDVAWVAYTLNGKLRLCSADCRFYATDEAYQAGFKAIDSVLGGKREYITSFHDTHRWYHSDGKFAIIYDEDDSPLLIYSEDNGDPTLALGPKYERYTIDPDQRTLLLEVTRNGFTTK